MPVSDGAPPSATDAVVGAVPIFGTVKLSCGTVPARVTASNAGRPENVVVTKFVKCAGKVRPVFVDVESSAAKISDLK